MRTLLSPEDAEHGLKRLANQILTDHRGSEGLLLVGIRRGGVPLAEELSALISAGGGHVEVGTVDISLYRDDAGVALPNPRIGPSKLPVKLEGLRVILCDDVLYTGRTVRAAVDALLDYGRPAQVQLLVLVERNGRELPIQADYSVCQVTVDSGERIDVRKTDTGFLAVTAPLNAPSTPPKRPESATDPKDPAQ